ncbi:MAG: peptide chain release factor 3 [Leptospiraceae bacterium]|nr:peptide chain release factor 3 [Leptospiraceae bacterium]MDW7976646.1 peptide chain release factor 3 [Leptospiraceae bacterium]
MDNHFYQEIQKRRTFAIIAHPDAGKTTLTEKLLLYGGAIQLAGHVRAKKDRRKTQSDWMKLEQERGISITTSAMQFEYNDFVLNLLDTPGHEDFSEDTYRTLMAVDSAIMLIDAAKGVEPQTIKLFQICRQRNIPIITFINKMDLPAKDPFELLDEVEKVLGISTTPMLWPLGSGKDFKGVYHIQTQKIYLYEKTLGGMYKAPVQTKGLDDPYLKEILDEEAFKNFKEGLELALGILPKFDLKEFHEGKITPVYFGSALNNFGIELFLNEFIQIAPPPKFIKFIDGNIVEINPEQFMAFVFKLQANMNKAHRDRVAFIRIVSGKFEKGMDVQISYKKKSIKLSSPVSFFGQRRNTIDEAYPGDIIGLINSGIFQIGDILYTGSEPKVTPLPEFAPELFARFILTDTSKMKSFKKGIVELTEEGVIQVFYLPDGTQIFGAVGQLQFEVFQSRLLDEYQSPTRLELLPFECSRWILPKDAQKFSSYDLIVKDKKENLVVLFKSEYRMKSFQKEHPDVPLFHSPLELEKFKSLNQVL